MKFKILLILLFVFIFSSCRSNSTVTTPTIVASTSDLPTAYTSSTPTFTPEKEEVEELPLANISDAPTASAIFTSTAAPRDEEIQELSEEFFSQQCQSVGYQDLAGFYPSVYFSPTGEWSFTTCENISNDEATYPFIISQLSQKKTWVFDTKGIAPDFIENYPSTWFTPDYWGKDEKNLIFRASLSCPDSFECLYEDGKALYMIDLESGGITVLLPPQITSPRFSYAFSISPDGKYLSYIDQSAPEVVHVQDLISGDDKAVNLNGKFSRVGVFVWTPDSKEFVFAGLSQSNNSPTSSLFSFNIASSSLSVLFNNRIGVFFPDSLKDDNVEYWRQQDVLYLGSLDYGHWYINIRTKEIIQVPTSVP